jgi:hypothetical protein
MGVTYKVLDPVPIVVTENELGGTATTIGADILTPKTNELLGVPATGNTAAGALVGVMVTAITFVPGFINPQ